MQSLIQSSRGYSARNAEAGSTVAARREGKWQASHAIHTTHVAATLAAQVQDFLPENYGFVGA
ncbi:MAG TPA: hypothetical protein VGR96_13020 [Acidobacteriaceae bacterium]|nr:hypothetical protein [Acidobacteriaceae bacterium]